MFVMISPRQAHLSETLTSLKFATKVGAPDGCHQISITDELLQVHNTHIGTAKRQAKVKE